MSKGRKTFGGGRMMEVAISVHHRRSTITVVQCSGTELFGEWGSQSLMRGP